MFFCPPPQKKGNQTDTVLLRSHAINFICPSISGVILSKSWGGAKLEPIFPNQMKVTLKTEK